MFIACLCTPLKANAAQSSPKEYKWNGVRLDYTSYGDGVIISKGSYEASHTVGKWTPYIAYYNLCQIKKMGTLKGYLTYHYTFGSNTANSIRWIANQGQIVTITETKTVSRTTTETVSTTNSISVSATIGKILNLGVGWTGSVEKSFSEELSFTYGCDISQQYDLSKFKHSSYTFASYGIICELELDKFASDGKTINSKTPFYAYYAAYGQELRLIYRY